MKMKMIKSIIFPLFLLSNIVTHAQEFEQKEMVKIPQATIGHAYMAEINGDSLEDAIISYNKNDSIFINIYHQMSDGSFVNNLTLSNLAQSEFSLGDFDNNGFPDILAISSDKQKSYLNLYLNDSSSSFEKKNIYEPTNQVSHINIQDLNHDGLKDILFLEKKENKNTLNFLQATDSMDYQVDNLLSSDFDILNYLPISINGDGFDDLLLNTKENDSLFIRALTFNDPSMEYQSHRLSQSREIEKWQFTDINHDGKADFVGVTLNGELLSYNNFNNDFEEDNIDTLNNEVSFLHSADFNNDGLYDILYTEQMNDQQLPFKTTFLKGTLDGTFQSDSLLNPLNQINILNVADFDDDGLLDLLGSKIENDTLSLVLIQNKTEGENIGPPQSAVFKKPVTIGNKTTFSWYPTIDDKTPSASITYDFSLQDMNANQYLVTSAYNKVGASRQAYRNQQIHGNAGYDTSYPIYDLPTGKYKFDLLGVDNAYYSSISYLEGIGQIECNDTLQVSQCLEILKEDTVACVYDTLELDFANDIYNVEWYSVNRGFIGEENSLRYVVEKDDKVYAIATPPCDSSELCFINYGLSIKVNGSENVFDFTNDSFCPDSTYSVNISGTYDEAMWYTDTDTLSNTHLLQFKPKDSTTIYIRAKADSGCYQYDTLVLAPIKKYGKDMFTVSDTSLCKGTSFTPAIALDDSLKEDFDFFWHLQNGTTTKSPPQILVDTENEIVLESRQENCYQLFDTLSIHALPLPEIQSDDIVETYPNEPVQLSATGGIRYEWTPADGLNSTTIPNPFAKINETTTYVVTGYDDNNCSNTDTTTVKIIPSVYIPELFSPNGDGNNDNLVVYGEGLSGIELSIYNKNGERVYHSDSINEIMDSGWDGSINGTPVSSGTYIWKISGTFNNGSNVTSKGKTSGEILLVR